MQRSHDRNYSTNFVYSSNSINSNPTYNYLPLNNLENICINTNINNFKQDNNNSSNKDNNKNNNNSNKDNNDKLHIKYTTINYENSGNPLVFGPPLWFSLHNGAARYPQHPSTIWKERMKNFILGIPIMIPCEKCMIHANAYIYSELNNLDLIVSSREELFKFFWKFHNYVNVRLNKQEISLEDAYKLYTESATITKMEY